MILLFVFVLAVVWGFLRGGSISNLQKLSLHGSGIVLAAFGIQVFLMYFPAVAAGNSLVHNFLIFASYAMLGVFIVWNRHLPGMWLFGIGFAANGLAILANGGYMPITHEALVAAGLGRAAASSAPGTLVFGSKDILLPFAQMQMGFLSDMFVVPPPFPIPSVFSVGDVFIALGIFSVVPGVLGSRTITPLGTYVSQEGAL